jgi:sugar O-acyltransferase (sialic acid O-acetyltransferase NeuD family)
VLESKKVFLFGYSGHAYVIIESLLKAGVSISGYFDYVEASLNPYNLQYCGFERNVDVNAIVKDYFVFPSIGDNIVREKLIQFFEEKKLTQCIVTDPSAIISTTAQIGVSSYIGKNVAINAQSNIGKGVIVNTSSTVEHECIIKNFVHLGPGSVLCGNVEVGDRSFVGANSVVKNNTSICSDVTVGAGSVVVKSITEKGIWVGNPSKKL